MAKDGIDAEVIDLRSLVPIDYHRVLESVKKTGRAVVVHAAVEFCGLGAEICSTINEELWAAGAPVIAADSLGPGLLIKHKENGLLVPVDDAISMAEAIKWLSNDVDLDRKSVV